MKKKETILLHLLKSPKKELHIRGLERRLKIPAQTISKSLKQLKKEELITIKEIGKVKIARVLFNQKTRALATYLLIKEKEEANPNIQPIIDRIKTIPSKIIILFGSSLKDLARANDIDILCIDEDLDTKAIDKQTTTLSAQLPKPVVPLLIELKDIKKQYDNKAVQEAMMGIIIKGVKEYIKIMEDLK